MEGVSFCFAAGAGVVSFYFLVAYPAHVFIDFAWSEGRAGLTSTLRTCGHEDVAKRQLGCNGQGNGNGKGPERVNNVV